ncbi:hypothetical protein C8R45DRAFT_841728 [Mycena sanguinolenta]|nr:hypothetical protein C8R45DRAFT_841850 [Mycena sanguinolenta]KAJ6462109.1 hypothetical protein C8R45DRAFT_841728 [Mycena sanguinolenta]
MANFVNGIAPIVTVQGPGNLHHLAYSSDLNGAISNIVGFVSTPAEAATNPSLVTNFHVGFSYYFFDFAFYWDGQGPAFWRMGNSSVQFPVGTSWTAATDVPRRNTSEVELGVDVSAIAASAQDDNTAAVVYIIPRDLD